MCWAFFPLNPSFLKKIHTHIWGWGRAGILRCFSPAQPRWAGDTPRVQQEGLRGASAELVDHLMHRFSFGITHISDQLYATLVVSINVLELVAKRPRRAWGAGGHGRTEAAAHCATWPVDIHVSTPSARAEHRAAHGNHVVAARPWALPRARGLRLPHWKGSVTREGQAV